MRSFVYTVAFVAALSSILPALAKTVPSPVLTHAFSVQVSITKPLGPIPIAGGATLVTPILGGNITGSEFSGTVASGGAAEIPVINNGKTATPFVEIWGTADDGSDFFVQGNGVGEVGAQFARLEVACGGKYAALANEFILATFTDNEEMTMSNIEAWIVTRQ